MLIAITNLKGGCGKSTIAVNVACELASRPRTRVAVVDADAQGTANHYASAGLLPVPCNHLPLDDSRKLESWVRAVLAVDADYIILDAPPHVGAVTQAIIGIADLVLVPCSPSGADLVATMPAIELVRSARKERKDGGPRCMLVPSRVDSRTAAGREIESALKSMGEPVGPAIHQRSAFVDAFSAGKWIGQYQARGPAHEEITALANAVRKVKV